MNSATRLIALLGYIGSLGSALQVAVQAPDSSGCTKKSCPFSFTNPESVNEGRCGEVDAAARLPDDIWKDPERVQEYVLATIKWYHVGGSTLKQSLCDRTGRTQKGSENVSWTDPTLMKYTCYNVCGCNYPLCPDGGDVPRNHAYCSLCGPKFNKDIDVKFWYPLNSSSTIVDIALATPDLSTLVTALKAGDLVDTLSGPGPFTVFAPTNQAFDAVPSSIIASLLKPENKAQLDDVLTYHVVSGSVHAGDLKDGERLKTVEGNYLTVRISSDGDIFINSAKVTTADVDASNGEVHIIDGVLLR